MGTGSDVVITEYAKDQGSEASTEELKKFFNQPPTHHLSRFFQCGHLPPKLRDVSTPFKELADYLLATIPSCQQLDAALTKLLEAKDCAVRASLPEEATTKQGDN